MTEPRAYTEEEVREMFLNRLRGLVEYWSTIDSPTVNSVEDRMNGLVFSILSTIDGCSMDIPMLDIALHPAEEDKAYHQENGENWFEPGMVFNDCYLHDMWHK